MNYNKKLQVYFAQATLFLPILFGFFLYLFNLPFILIWIFIIFIHIFSSIPLEILLSKRNKWESKKQRNKPRYKNYLHPKIYRHLSLAMVYPYVYIFPIILIRYSNLGRVNDFLLNFEILVLFLIVIIIGICHFHLVFYLLNEYKSWKNYFRESLNSIIYPIYIYLLKSNIFYKSYCVFHYMSYYIRESVYLKTRIYKGFDQEKDFWLFRKLLSKIYENSHKIFFTILFISFILEILVLHKLYYFYYISFICLIIKYIGDVIWITGRRMLFFREVCLSDYIHKNYINPRYKHNFWISMLDQHFFFGFIHEYVTQEEFDLSKIKSQEYFDSLELYNIKIKVYLNSNDHLIKLRKKVAESKIYPLKMRVKSSYMYDHRGRTN